ncbi:MAG: hypothetical protein D6820_01115, partial [Lentisphaerae bacterium]
EETWFNGVKIGSSRHWIEPRRHRIPGKLVRRGKNVIAVRTWDEMVHGGWCALAPERIYLAGTDIPNWYHPDYIEAWGKDYLRADDPYRYQRW